MNYNAKKLEWDSHYFGFPCSKICIKSELKELDKREIRKIIGQYRLNMFSNEMNLPENQRWLSEDLRAFLTDINVQMVKKRIGQNKNNSSVEINKNMMPNTGILKIAENAFLYSKFLNDCRLPKEKAERVYYFWVKNAFNSDHKHFAVYRGENGSVDGFILFSFPGREEILIEIIAVDKKRQGQGIGKKLLEALENYASENNVYRMNVGTQIENIQALNFYIKNGFYIDRIVYTYHKWS